MIFDTIGVELFPEHRHPPHPDTLLWWQNDIMVITTFAVRVTFRFGKNNPYTSRALMEGINMEKSSQGCYKAMQLSQ